MAHANKKLSVISYFSTRRQLAIYQVRFGGGDGGGCRCGGIWSELCDRDHPVANWPDRGDVATADQSSTAEGGCGQGGAEADRAELMRLIRWEELGSRTLDCILAWCDSRSPAACSAPPPAKAARPCGGGADGSAAFRRGWRTAEGVAAMRELAERARCERAGGGRRGPDGPDGAGGPGGDGGAGRRGRRGGGLGPGARLGPVRRTEASVYCLAASAELGVVCSGGVDGSVGHPGPSPPRPAVAPSVAAALRPVAATPRCGRVDARARVRCGGG